MSSAATVALSKARKTIDSITTTIVMFVAASLFLIIVPFLPAQPFLPVLVSAGIAALFFKRPKWASGLFGGIVFFAIFWQLTGFGIFGLGALNPVGMLFLYILGFVPILLTRSKSPIAVPLASLAVALMLTPFYYFSVPLIGIVTFVSGMVGVGTLVACFVLYLLPFLLIENAFIFSFSGDTIPVAFAQLTNVINNIRPSLSGLNVFITEFPPAGFILDASQNHVIEGLKHPNFLGAVILPVLIFIVVFIASASVAGVTESIVKKLRNLEGLERQLKWVAPLTVPIIMPIVFGALIVALSSADIGKYIAFQNMPYDLIIMIAASVAIGAAFAGREILIQFLERTEFARKRATTLITELNMALESNQFIISRVSAGAPALDLNAEGNKINSCRSAISDIESNMQTADYDTLTRWIASLEQSQLETSTLPELVRVKLVNELNTLSSFLSTFNASLQETGIAEKLPEITSNVHTMSIDVALEEYKRVMKDIRSTISVLYVKYVETTKAFSEISNLEQVSPPVNPLAVFDANDTIMAMKLTCEEYWLTFHTRRKDELSNKTLNLVGQLSKLEDKVHTQSYEQIKRFSVFASKIRPIDSPHILAQLKILRTVLTDAVIKAKNENEKLNIIINKMLPVATKILTFESVDQAKKLQDLFHEVSFEKVAFDDISAAVESMVSTLQFYEDSKKRDTEKLIIVSQYPVARKVIADSLQERDKVTYKKLPFKRNVSEIYLRLFAASTPKTIFDEETEELSLE